ncbi:MAG: hypothetical protein AAGI68_02360 [Planctomycetota bacterium]
MSIEKLSVWIAGGGFLLGAVIIPGILVIATRSPFPLIMTGLCTAVFLPAWLLQRHWMKTRTTGYDELAAEGSGRVVSHGFGFYRTFEKDLTDGSLLSIRHFGNDHHSGPDKSMLVKVEGLAPAQGRRSFDRKQAEEDFDSLPKLIQLAFSHESDLDSIDVYGDEGSSVEFNFAGHYTDKASLQRYVSLAEKLAPRFIPKPA